MGKGKTKNKLPDTHPDKWTRRLVRGRVDLDPRIVPTVVVFLDMLCERYKVERAKILGRSSGLDPGHYNGLADRFQRLVDSCTTIAMDIVRPQSGVEFARAVARVLGAEEAGQPTIGTPPAGTPEFSRREA